MKNQYFADINDYRKYGLIRQIFLYTKLRVDICFMLTRDDNSRDGNKVGYLLSPNKWAHYDEELFYNLKGCINSGKRNVKRVRSFLPGKINSELLRHKADERRLYMENVIGQCETSDFVFLDPDNGFEIKSVPYGRKGSEKYLYYSELYKIYLSNCGVLVYQHFARRNRFEQIRKFANNIFTAIPIDIIHFFSTSMVTFILLPQPRHFNLFDGFADHMAAIWKQEFSYSVFVRESA